MAFCQKFEKHVKVEDSFTSPFKSNIYYVLGLPNVRIDWYDFIFLMGSRGSFSQASFHFDEKIFFNQWYNIHAKVTFIYYVSTCIAKNLI